MWYRARWSQLGSLGFWVSRSGERNSLPLSPCSASSLDLSPLLSWSQRHHLLSPIHIYINRLLQIPQGHKAQFNIFLWNPFHLIMQLTESKLLSTCSQKGENRRHCRIYSFSLFLSLTWNHSPSLTFPLHYPPFLLLGESTTAQLRCSKGLPMFCWGDTCCSASACSFAHPIHDLKRYFSNTNCNHVWC